MKPHNMSAPHRTTLLPYLLTAVISIALALGVGLALRPWLAGGQAEAHPQAQAQAPAQSAAPLVPNATPATPPTTAADATNQVVNGLTVSVTNFRRQGSQVRADVCFDLPDGESWIIWPATFRDKAGTEISDYGSLPILLRRFPVDGQQKVTTFTNGQKDTQWEPATSPLGWRCDTLYFEVPPKADLSHFTLTIHALAATPREGEYCTTHLAKVQAALDAREPGIKLACTEAMDGSHIDVVGQPTLLSLAEVEAIIHSDTFYKRPGPWIFEGSLK